MSTPTHRTIQEKATTIPTGKRTSTMTAGKQNYQGKKIEMIEEACKDIMDTLDYRPYKSVMEEHGDSGT